MLRRDDMDDGKWSIAQADLGLRCPLTESMAIVVYVDELRKSRSDCTDARAHIVVAKSKPRNSIFR